MIFRSIEKNSVSRRFFIGVHSMYISQSTRATAIHFATNSHWINLVLEQLASCRLEHSLHDILLQNQRKTPKAYKF